MLKKTIHITGMHCASCEKLLKEEFDAIEGVIDAKVSLKTSSAEIFYKDLEPDFVEIKKTAQKFNYDVFEKKQEIEKKRSFNLGDWIKGILLTLALLLIFRFFQNTGFLDQFNPNQSKVSYGVAFLVGIVASLSTCLAIVGALVISFAEKYQARGKNFYENSVQPNLFFQIGRISTFFVLGGILGLIGGELNLSGRFISAFTIFIAAIMFWLGLNILGILPSLSATGIKMPGILTRKWTTLKDSEHKMAPFLLGGLSFFLPCGFTQSMQLFALASGSFWVGALTLLFFSLGTLPIILALGVTASATKNSKTGAFKITAGILILIFAVYTFSSGWALLKQDTNTTNNITNQETKQDTTNQQEKEQIIRMSITSRGFEPSVLKIKKGVPVKWIINGDGAGGCTSKIVVPSLGLEKNIVSGENIVTFTPKNSGEINFSCWMGMVRGKFIVD